MYMYQGLLFCNRCRCRYISSNIKLGSLAQPCEPPKDYGKLNLLRFNRGDLPVNVDSWPASAESETQYNLYTLLGDIDPQALGPMQAWAYDFHQLTLQANVSSPPFSPYSDSDLHISEQDVGEISVPGDSDSD